MTFASVRTIKRVVLGSLCVGALVSITGTALVSAAPEKTRKLHAVKECTEYFGNAGEWCTISVSNVRQMPIGSRFLYSQAAGIPAGLLDSNVVLDAGDGNRAQGRCTLDIATQIGLCTFSDGVGELLGFQAHINVACPGDGIVCSLEGTYSFRDAD